jgi:hypothetical protein
MPGACETVIDPPVQLWRLPWFLLGVVVPLDGAGIKSAMVGKPLSTSLRATGSRECAPDDKLREAIHTFLEALWIASSLRSSQ